MTKKEFATFTMALKTYYPRENLLPNEQAMELWFSQLQDIPFEVAQAGLQKWVATNKWSPSIADIREMYASITQGELPDWGDAWDEVQRAIRYFGHYREDEAMESLSPLTKKVVRRMGFKNICISETPMNERANFRMIYESLAEKEKKNAQIPAQLKNLIEDIRKENPLLIGGGDNGNG